MRSMTSDMIGMAVVALMIMLVIGGGTTWVYVTGQRATHLPAAASTQGQASRKTARPPASQAAEHLSAARRQHRHGRRREFFLGP